MRRILFACLCVASISLLRGTAFAQPTWWDGFAARGFDDRVRAVTVYNNELIAGGYFSHNGTTPLKSMARWDGTQWVAMPGSENFSRVSAFAEYNGELYAGEYARVAKWDGSSWTAVPGTFMYYSFAPVTGSALAVYDGKLIVAGDIESVDGVYTGSIAAWNGTGWESLGGFTLQDADFSMVVYQGDLYVASDFGITEVAYTPTHGIARWDGTSWSAVYGSDGTTSEEGLWQELGPSAEADVWGLAVWNDKLVIAGEFARAGTFAADNIVTWDGATQMWGSVDGGLDARATSLGMFDGDIVAAGEFALAGATPAPGIARFDGASWSAMGAGVDGPVDEFCQFGSDLVIGGKFGKAGAGRAGKLAVWDGAGYSTLQNTPGRGLDDYPTALTVWDDKLVAVGRFLHAGNVAARRVAAWDGSSWENLGAGVDKFVNAVCGDGPDLYVGGDFTEAGGMNTGSVARWDGTSWHALDPAFTDNVHCLAVYNGDLYAGTYALERWDGSTWTEIPLATSSSLISVRALVPYDGKLVAVGSDHLIEVDSQHSGVAMWDGTQWLPMLTSSGFLGGGTDFYAAVEWDGILTMGTSSTLYAWDGATLEGTGPHFGSYLNELHALATHDGNLYAVGQPGYGSNASSVIYLEPGGTDWVPASGPQLDTVYGAASYLGGLYVGGNFNTLGADGTPSNCIGAILPTSTDVEDSPAPGRFALLQNHPNPFNPTTVIPYNVPVNGSIVSLAIFDVGGRLVRQLVSRPQAAGPHNAIWNGTDDRGRDVASGVYFYTLSIGAHKLTGKMTLVK